MKQNFSENMKTTNSLILLNVALGIRGKCKKTYVNYRRHGGNNDNYASSDRLNNRQLWPVGYTGVWLLNALTHSAVLVRRCGKHWQLTPTPSFCKNCLNNPPLLSTATESYTLWVKKTRQWTLAHNFPKCWPIFYILSLTDSSVNLQQTHV